MASAKDMFLRIDCGQIPQKKKMAVGVRGMKLGAGDELSDETALKIMAKLVKQGRDTAALYKEQGREDLAGEELAQVEAIETYLPKALSDEELISELKVIIDEVGATNAKEMGKVMGIASKKLARKAEGKAISEKVRALLA